MLKSVCRLFFHAILPISFDTKIAAKLFNREKSIRPFTIQGHQELISHYQQVFVQSLGFQLQWNNAWIRVVTIGLLYTRLFLGLKNKIELKIFPLKTGEKSDRNTNSPLDLSCSSISYGDELCRTKSCLTRSDDIFSLFECSIQVWSSSLYWVLTSRYKWKWPSSGSGASESCSTSKCSPGTMYTWDPPLAAQHIAKPKMINSFIFWT